MPKPNGALLTRYQSSLSTCDARASLQSILPQQQQTGASFHVAVPALAELLYGIQILPRATRNIENWQAIEGLFTYYQIEKQDAEYAASLQVLLRRQGRQLATIDALMAAIALRYDLILLTTDQDFRAIPGLSQGSW